MKKHIPNQPLKRFILTGETAAIFRGLFDSFGCGSETEQSMLLTCARGTIITCSQLERIEARLEERNTFLQAYTWNVSKCYMTGNDLDEYDEDGCLIALSAAEPGITDERDETENDKREWENAKAILARIFHDEGVKPMKLPDGSMGYHSEPDGGERMRSLYGDWRFNAKFIVELSGDWEVPMMEDDTWAELARHMREKFPRRYEYDCRRLTEGWDWEEYTLFPLPAELQKEERAEA